MVDGRSLLVAVFYAALATVARVRVEMLDLPTSCEGWSVRDVLNHAAAVTMKFSAFARGETDRPRQASGDVLGAGPVAAFVQIVEDASGAWRHADMSRTCHLSFGSFSAAHAAGVNAVDLLAHVWDVGRAAGTPVVVEDVLWLAALDIARVVVGDAQQRDLAHYDPPRPVARAAPPAERFVAYLGRG